MSERKWANDWLCSRRRRSWPFLRAPCRRRRFHPRRHDFVNPLCRSRRLTRTKNQPSRWFKKKNKPINKSVRFDAGLHVVPPLPLRPKKKLVTWSLDPKKKTEKENKNEVRGSNSVPTEPKKKNLMLDNDSNNTQQLHTRTHAQRSILRPSWSSDDGRLAPPTATAVLFFPPPH